MTVNGIDNFAGILLTSAVVVYADAGIILDPII